MQTYYLAYSNMLLNKYYIEAPQYTWKHEVNALAHFSSISWVHKCCGREVNCKDGSCSFDAIDTAVSPTRKNVVKYIYIYIYIYIYTHTFFCIVIHNDPLSL